METKRVTWLVLGLLAALILGLMAFGLATDDSDSHYDACAKAAERSGIPASHPDFLYRVGQCMERLENR